MAKDPAFLLYSKDWLQGTAQMSHEEKGVYIDLLCHQHQEDGLPHDTQRLARIANLTHEKFLEIWTFLSAKFEQNGSKLYNRKLEQIVAGRSEHGEMRRIIGTFGRAIKDFSATEEEKKQIRKVFNYKDFINLDQQNLSKAISKWLATIQASTTPICSPNGAANIGNGTEDGNGNGNVFSFEGAGKFSFTADLPIPPNTLEAAERNQFTHTRSKNTDFVKEHWRTFLLERLDDPPIKRMEYKSIGDLSRYFLNFLRTKFPNGQHTASTTGKTFIAD
jgi:uncharacterized protein YdaU (DUF1376 family)